MVRDKGIAEEEDVEESQDRQERRHKTAEAKQTRTRPGFLSVFPSQGDPSRDAEPGDP